LGPSLPSLQQQCLSSIPLQRTELAAAAQAGSGQGGLPHEQQLQQQQQQRAPASSDPVGLDVLAGGGSLDDDLGLQQPLLYFSVRSAPPLGPEPPPLSGPSLEADGLPIQQDPLGRLVGQVSMVEAGRVHGWVCLKGIPYADLKVTAYVDGVRAGTAQATLPTQSQHVQRLCQLDAFALEDDAAAGSAGAGGSGVAAAAAGGQQALAVSEGGVGVGFIVPLPPLPQGIHVVGAVRSVS
jgi:hypothetical protein